MSGFVSFVGSGPGDPELLTLKAVDRLKKADAILFDDLSSGPILEYASPEADLVGVGKRAGRPSPKQDHVSQLLVDYAKAGGHVVRLKSGDSGIFGRLEEEIDALRAAGINFEIIPGVTSACAAAAAAQIPLTRRLVARRVQFVTGHDVAGALPGDLHLQSLADPGATTVLFMPKRTFPALAEKLFATGLRRDCPALLAENVSHPDQTLQRSTMEELSTQLSETISNAPGLILFGELAEST
ncbi:uroporphyrinogen-III C-methyltransferase [Shimia aestuarii]|uniref:uroporphyrinogen-III C-methyltransferase n=1 Tax=Shimia aestuarii TaxID=254406 RepID=A0A1I4R0C9_9RHOB|nr:uroporphyrinogen-III C-methyltransferase [Shimia aestuarii]SFM45784.1 uroporphyrinogen-III C-methyltransferase [Shimia aestuarii]